MSDIDNLPKIKFNKNRFRGYPNGVSRRELLRTDELWKELRRNTEFEDDDDESFSDDEEIQRIKDDMRKFDRQRGFNDEVFALRKLSVGIPFFLLTRSTQIFLGIGYLCSSFILFIFTTRFTFRRSS
jgi:hypothetical protein